MSQIRASSFTNVCHTDYPINPVLVGNYYFKEMSHKARIQEITSHYTRVTYASYAIKRGLSINDLQKQLVNSNSIMIHSFDKINRNIYNK